MKCSRENRPFGEIKFDNKIEVVHLISNYNDKLNFPHHLSNLAKDFIFCCLRKNPFNRKNVYKLLQHPFITSNHRESNEDVSMRQVLCGPEYNQLTNSKHRGERHQSMMKSNQGMNGRQIGKDNMYEINSSNYDQVIANFEKKGNDNNKLIIELQKDLDEKTFAIEIRLKEKKRSQKFYEEEKTPDSPILNKKKFFEKEINQNQFLDVPKRPENERLPERPPLSNIVKQRLAMHEKWKEREKTVELYGEGYKRDLRKSLGTKAWEPKYPPKR
jgi:serine/threonine protein kinase